MTGKRRWGRAGVPLTAQEATKIARRRMERTIAAERAYREWAAGKAIPYRITQALNLRALYGPEVDEACGVEEPAVDEWEAGVRYPSWDQLRALAVLTDFPVWYFVRPLPDGWSGLEATSMMFHKIGGKSMDWREPPPIRFFTPEAIAAGTAPDAPSAAGQDPMPGGAG